MTGRTDGASRHLPGTEAAVPASLRRRLAAFGVDYLVVALYLAALTVVGLGLLRTTALAPLWEDPLRAQLSGFLLVTLPVVLYFALSEGSEAQATVGKRLLGLRVVTTGGRRLPWGRALLRSAVKFAPWEFAHTCLWRIPGWPESVEAVPGGVVAGLVAVWLLVALYLVAPLSNHRRQAPYDRAARSMVVRRFGAPGPTVSPGDWNTS